MSPTTLERLSALAVALQDVLHTHSHRAIARSLGLSPETPSTRGPRPTHWPLDDLLRLAEQHPTIADALRGLFAAPSATSPSASPETAVKTAIGSAAGLIQHAIDRLADDHLGDDELRDTDAEIASVQTQLSQARAVIRARRRRA